MKARVAGDAQQATEHNVPKNRHSPRRVSYTLSERMNGSIADGSTIPVMHRSAMAKYTMNELATDLSDRSVNMEKITNKFPNTPGIELTLYIITNISEIPK